MNPINTEITEPTAAPETIAGYPVHPAANLLPDPSPEEYTRLKDDIKQHGIRVPIVMTRDGQILDGRSRARACVELGLDIHHRYGADEWSFRVAGKEEEADPFKFVLSMNAARRHLNPEQVAALYLQVKADKIEADRQMAKAAQKAGLKRGTVRERTNAPTGKTAARIARDVGVSTRTVEKVQEVQRKAPERLADVAAGKASAGEVLKERKAPKRAVGDETLLMMPSTQGPEAVEASGFYLGELVKVSSSIISQIKETVKSKHGVSTKDHEAAAEAVEKLREALQTIAPVWKCEECSDVLEPRREPESRYECGECGDETLKEKRCGSCNKFATKVSDTACEMEGCCGEMVLVGWETVIDLIAAQAKKYEEEEQRSSAEWAAKKEFAKTKAGKAEAAKKAAEDKAYEVARLKKDEDRTLELARLIAKGRAEGKTTEQVKRKEEKATLAEHKARRAAQEAAWAAEIAEEEAAEVSHDGDPATEPAP